MICHDAQQCCPPDSPAEHSEAPNQKANRCQPLLPGDLERCEPDEERSTLGESSFGKWVFFLISMGKTFNVWLLKFFFPWVGSSKMNHSHSL